MCPTGPGVFNFNFILMRAFLKSLREIGVSKFVLSESLSGSLSDIVEIGRLSSGMSILVRK